MTEDEMNQGLLDEFSDAQKALLAGETQLYERKRAVLELIMYSSIIGINTKLGQQNELLERQNAILEAQNRILDILAMKIRN